MKQSILIAAFNSILAGLLSAPALCQTTFFLSPSGNAAGDSVWLSMAGPHPVATINFDSIPRCTLLNNVQVGGLIVDLRLLEPNGTVMQFGAGDAPLLLWGDFSIQNGGCGQHADPETIWLRALSNGNNGCIGGCNTGQCYWRRHVQFRFSRKISGFGVWLYDDMQAVNHSFTMRVTTSNGQSFTSGLLSNPCTAPGVVEGFIGVHSNTGIVEVVIESTGGGYFEMDNIQMIEMPSIGAPYCGPAVLNSTGQPGVIRAFGSTVTGSGQVMLEARELPHLQFGYFLNSMSQGSVANPAGSQGVLCLSGGIGRYAAQVVNTGPLGVATLVLDPAQTPTPTGSVAIAPGDTWNFQFWFRDGNPTPTSNFTDAVSITFQ
jgi:hypothetical protein